MTARLLLPAVLLLGFSASARAYDEDKSKPHEKPGAEARPSVDLDERLGSLEKQLGALLKEVQGLRQEVRTRTAAGGRVDEMRVFSLKRANAAETAKVLQGLLQGKDGQQIKIVSDERTNQVLVTGRRDVMDAVEAIVSRLDEADGKRKDPEAKPEKPRGKESGAKLDDAKERLRQLERDAEAVRDRATWAERMAQKGHLPSGRVEVELKSVRDAMELLQKARDIYRKYTEEEKKPARDEPAPKK